MNKKHIKRRICRLVALIMLFVSFPMESFAYSIQYLGYKTPSVGNGDLSYDVRGYVYYNSNTSTYLDVHTLLLTGKNKGVYDLNEFRFETSEGNFDKSVVTYQTTTISSGKEFRLEAEWASVCNANGYSNTKFMKNGSENTVYTDLSIGTSYAGMTGFETFWYPDKILTSFHE